MISCPSAAGDVHELARLSEWVPLANPTLEGQISDAPLVGVPANFFSLDALAGKPSREAKVLPARDDVTKQLRAANGPGRPDLVPGGTVEDAIGKR